MAMVYGGDTTLLQVKTVIAQSTLRAVPSERLESLARHKTYPPLPIKTASEWDWGEWHSDISPVARAAMASGRVMALAEPKQPHPLFEPSKPVRWEVCKAAQQHVASERMAKLALPKNRSGELEDYDPRTWSVSRGALAAQPSPRITELATPLPRKCRPKKT